jgi:hypothetical protein
VKDMRVMIAKKAWAEVWRWGEKEDAHVEKKAHRGLSQSFDVESIRRQLAQFAHRLSQVLVSRI